MPFMLPSLFISREGKIHYKHVGALTEKILKTKIEEML